MVISRSGASPKRYKSRIKRRSGCAFSERIADYRIERGIEDRRMQRCYNDLICVLLGSSHLSVKRWSTGTREGRCTTTRHCGITRPLLKEVLTFCNGRYSHVGSKITRHDWMPMNVVGSQTLGDMMPRSELRNLLQQHGKTTVPEHPAVTALTSCVFEVEIVIKEWRDVG